MLSLFIQPFVPPHVWRNHRTELEQNLILIGRPEYILFVSYMEPTLEAQHQFADIRMLRGRTDTIVEFVAS
jgi:hypothetical protein